MKIAVLGTGKVGTALGTRLASAGHHVNYGSRKPSSAAQTLSHREAADASVVVFTAVPGTEVVTTLEAIGDEVLGDKIVLDPSAAFTSEMAMAYPGDSVGQRVQARFPSTDPYYRSPGTNKTLLTMVDAEHTLGGISGYDAAETTDENRDRVATLRALVWAYLTTALHPDDPSWSRAAEALARQADPIARIETRQAAKATDGTDP